MRILVNDFIGGVLDRGIPLYVRNLIDGLREEGFQVSVVRAPALCRLLPRNLFYMIAVMVEQIILPLIGFLSRSDLTIYPYNSIALIDVFTRRGRIVVHDLEQLDRPSSFSKSYYLMCYRALKSRNAPVFTASDISRLRIIKSGLFGDGTISILPNTFSAFERLVRAEAPERKPATSILLSTGSTANKDLETLVADYLPKALAQGYRITIFGLHKSSDKPKLRLLRRFVASGQISLRGRLSDAAVAREYRSHAVVWVHSLREGFGRCVVEGRLAGSRVICTDIPEVAGLCDGEVYLYRDAAEFLTTLDRVARMDAPVAPYDGYPYREILRGAIERGLLIRASRTAAQSPQAISVRQRPTRTTPPQSQNP
jgi:glycosyltransferase involved in cell wall biosynthesis